MIMDDFYFTKNLNFPKEELHFLADHPNWSPTQIDSIKSAMSRLTTAYYETAKWMLVHNKKPSAGRAPDRTPSP
jgi:hypothetical protein